MNRFLPIIPSITILKLCLWIPQSFKQYLLDDEISASIEIYLLTYVLNCARKILISRWIYTCINQAQRGISKQEGQNTVLMSYMITHYFCTIVCTKNDSESIQISSCSYLTFFSSYIKHDVLIISLHYMKYSPLVTVCDRLYSEEVIV